MSRVLPVSVVIPCHRAATTLARAVESVARQSEIPAEVILVDDASEDRTADVVAELARGAWPFAMRASRLPENRGPGEARNEGCAIADPRSRYIAFLDADDAWVPAKLERQLRWMESHPDVTWTAHRCGIVGDAEVAMAVPRKAAARPITRTGLLLRNAVATPTVVVRATAGARFRPGWRWCEDLMLWLDLLDHGHRGAMLDESLAVLGRRPTTPGGSTGNLAAMYSGERRVIRTLVAEGRMSSPAALVWQTYSWARYLRRRGMA